MNLSFKKSYTIEDGIISTDKITVRISNITALKRKFNFRGIFSYLLVLIVIGYSIINQHYLDMVLFLVIALPILIFIVPCTKIVIYTDEKRKHSIHASSFKTEKMYAELQEELQHTKRISF